MDNLYSKIRKKYGLSRIGMSKILGFGVNQWRMYEDVGVEPKDSHALLIKLVMDPRSFKKMLKDNERVLGVELGKRRYDGLMKRVDEMLEEYESCEEASYNKWVESLYVD